MRQPRRILLMVAGILVLVAGLGIAQPKGPKITVKGEVVDLWCYLEGGDHGADHKQCATTCATAGNPIGILDAAGNLYVAAGIKDHQPGRDILIKQMSNQVT